MSKDVYLDSELYLASLDRACFKWGEDRSYEGALALDYEWSVEIGAMERGYEAYGRELFQAVFPRESELYRGLREALLAAELNGGHLRFRLRLSPDLPPWVHALFWELLSHPVPQEGALSRSPATAFSRYTALSRGRGEPISGRPRMLCVVSAPSNIAEKYDMAEIDREEVVGRLEDLAGELAESVEVEILEAPATLERLRERLVTRGGVHLLHFFGHGQSRGGSSALFLEDEDRRAKPVPEDLLSQLFLETRELRLVTLIACHGGAPSSDDPFSGLAGRLVQQGLPAVIAMRRAVSFENAHAFTEQFYRNLARTRRVDAAANEARQCLYLSHSDEYDWSSPILYSRLQDGRLWLPPEEEAAEAAAAGPLFRLSPRRLRHPVPWVPALLAGLLATLGLLPAPSAEARLEDLRVSQLGFQLARSATVVERLDLQEIGATQLAALRLPPVLPPARWQPAGRGRKGFRLQGLDESSRVTLNPEPLPAGAKVVLEHQGGPYYKLSVAGSVQEIRATFQGRVTLKPLHGSAAELTLEHPESLDLVPQGGAVELDLAFARFSDDALSREIPVDRLSFHRVAEQHTPGATLVREESTLLGGQARVTATGEAHPLEEGESLRFSKLAGSITGLRLAEDGIHLGFRGRVSDLARAAEGAEPQSLMPSLLDLWLPGPAQLPAQGASGALAAVVLFVTALEVRPRASRRRTAPGSMAPSTPRTKEV